MEVLQRAMSDLSNRLASNQLSMYTFEQAKQLLTERVALNDRTRMYFKNVSENSFVESNLKESIRIQYDFFLLILMNYS